MARQNRVTPFGDLLATPAKGLFLGNRGILHDAEGHIRRAWQVKRWLLCLLEFRGRKQTIMALNHYTQLFFLDEATGLAAGHRPCAECRRQQFNAFRHAWTLANPDRAAALNPTASIIDDQLHAERIGPKHTKRLFSANLDELPDGVFITWQGQEGHAFLIWNGRLLAWSPAGYRERRPRPKNQMVSVLTPASTVAAIRAGYRPEIHPSAQRL